MGRMKIACGSALELKYFSTRRDTVLIGNSDYTDVSAVVVTDQELEYIDQILDTKFNIPIFLILTELDSIPDELVGKVYHVIDTVNFDFNLYSRQIEAAAKAYEDNVLPPFFNDLKQYVDSGNSEFDCPGHQGGQFYRKHPAGRAFYEFYGEHVFRSDICNADVKLGDLLIHEGSALEAQKHAAKVFNADKTYFVLNGTSSSNKVVTNAVLTKDDLVLYDRNNHKSIQHGALTIAGAKPVYLQTARNPFGFIGGIDDACFDEDYLRKIAAEIDPEKAKTKRPFRLAVIQLGTYDGTIYNARQVVDRIGHLCDYILFDSAWVGYEQFIPMMKDCSPMLLDLTPEDPGIFVTQSVHKQQAGFSQASQIHKKDAHIKGQKRYCNHKRMNNAFMLHASTSPFYPLFASLDVNAKMHEGPAAKRLWMDCVEQGIDTRKLLLNTCSMIKPFVPDQVNGVAWKDVPTEEIKTNLDCFKFVPGQKWHSFKNYGENQYFLDPCKLLLTTPGIDTNTGKYTEFGIPATILANYLRENGIIPEKCDLNSILFLLTPAETKTKMQNLVSQIATFERLIKEDAPLEQVLPSVYKANGDRYMGYTIRRLCQEMHDYYKKNEVKTLQKDLFRKEHFPEFVFSPQEGQQKYIKGEDVDYVSLEDINGRVALEGALPYPPGVICVGPGEKWNEIAQKYFLTLLEGINLFPGFSPEIQGVYLEEHEGKITGHAYVTKKD